MPTSITTLQQHIDRMMEIAETLKKAKLMIGEEYDTWCSEYGRDESDDIRATENALLDAIHAFSRHVGEIMLYGIHDELKKEDRA